MIVINFFAGAGAGKSTAAAAAFVWLKQHNIVTELISEAARDMIYAGQTHLLENQLTVTSKQYAKLDNLRRHGCEVVVSDSSILLSKVYGKTFPAYRELCPLVDTLYDSFDNINIWVKRTKAYSDFGRVQKTEAEAKAFESEIFNLMPEVDLLMTGDIEGHKDLFKFLKYRFKGD